MQIWAIMTKFLALKMVSNMSFTHKTSHVLILATVYAQYCILSLNMYPDIPLLLQKSLSFFEF